MKKNIARSSNTLLAPLNDFRRNLDDFIGAFQLWQG